MDRVDELVAEAKARLDEARNAVADAAAEVRDAVVEAIDAASTKLDEIQEAWANREQPTQLPAEGTVPPLG